MKTSHGRMVVVDIETASLIAKLQKVTNFGVDYTVLVAGTGTDGCFKATIQEHLTDTVLAATPYLRVEPPPTGKQKAQWKTERNNRKP